MFTHYATFGGNKEHPVTRIGKMLIVWHGNYYGLSVFSYAPRSAATSLRRR